MQNAPSDKNKKEDQWSDMILPHDSLTTLNQRLYMVKTDGPMQIPRNMFLYVMKNGGLMIHGACALKEDEMEKVIRLGTPQVMIVPNGFHRRDARVYKNRFPQLLVLSPSACQKQVEEVIPVDATTESYFEKNSNLGVRVLDPGMKAWNELLYEVDLGNNQFGIIFTDCLMNVAPDKNFIGRLIQRFFGSYGDGRVPVITRGFRHCGFGSPQAVKTFLRKLQRPEVHILAVTHGNPVIGDCSGKLEQTIKKYQL